MGRGDYITPSAAGAEIEKHTLTLDQSRPPLNRLFFRY